MAKNIATLMITIQFQNVHKRIPLNMVEGSLDVKLPKIWTDGKAQPGRSSAMEKVRCEKIRDKTDQPWRKSRVIRS